MERGKSNFEVGLGWADIARGVGWLALDSLKRAGHVIFDHLQSEGLSEHPKYQPRDDHQSDYWHPNERMATISYPRDSEGAAIDDAV